ncbi:MAG: hypothetical protein IPG00_20205 [Saprospiraceae bacterium]|nr:hypothetical protein [Saprospiraceae bacterium]
MDRVICLIKRSSTGDASNFAAKLGMSEEIFIDLLSDMREVGFPVKYNAKSGHTLLMNLSSTNLVSRWATTICLRSKWTKGVSGCITLPPAPS